ncbi:MAG: FG-GAP repeat protein [Deltaproteobacteria bacterium]|nr:FG-GAP repeat protein [Deltaproteobacteria bacterium]
MTRPALLALLTPLTLILACGDKDSSDDPSGDDSAVTACGDADDDGVCDEADCAPDDPYSFPGAPDIPYDGKDNDCAGDGDLVDFDGDGYTASQVGGDDCNDGNPTVYPGAPETCYDGVDQDCSGTEDTNDCDGDGYDGRGDARSDCDDENADIYPGAEEIWYDGLDQDCSGFLDSDYDQDRDGDDATAYGGTDCDDEDPAVAGGLPERWDGVDSDCDSASDDLEPKHAARRWTGSAGVGDGFLGMGVAILDDYDGDGGKSVAFSGYGASDAGFYGGAYVFDSFEEAGRSTDTALTSVTGDEGSYFGFDLANVGDLDGDGLAELLIGGPLVANGLGLVFRGADLAAGGALDTDDALAGLSGNDYTGIDVAAAGDVNGDGVPDLAVGTGWLTSTHVVIYSGADAAAAEGGTLRTIEALGQIDASGGAGGLTVGGPDVDGDGLDDVLVAGITATFGATAIVYGAELVGGVAFTFSDLPYLRGDTNDSLIGVTSGWMDDSDGDGYPELLIRAYGEAGAAGTAGGVVYVVDAHSLDGTQQYASAVAQTIIDGDRDDGHLAPGETNGDLDGDGSVDLLLLSSGDRDQTWEFLGVTGIDSHVTFARGADMKGGGRFALADIAQTLAIESENSDDLLGYSNAVGDVNGDGKPDLLLGSPPGSYLAGYMTLFLNEL